MADAPDMVENQILKRSIDIDVDVLKVGHHGSTYSNSFPFLEKVSPKYAIISCGEDNDYYHPHTVTLDNIVIEEVK
jgi:competence protein ComEC